MRQWSADEELIVRRGGLRQAALYGHGTADECGERARRGTGGSRCASGGGRVWVWLLRLVVGQLGY